MYLLCKYNGVYFIRFNILFTDGVAMEKFITHLRAKGAKEHTIKTYRPLAHMR
jgi:hypothetical protein